MNQRRKLQFRLRTLLLVPVLLGALLAVWFGWIAPRLAFEKLRQESVSRMSWSGKDREMEYRTNLSGDALERSTYSNISTPRLVYAVVYKRYGVLLVDWIGADRPTEVRGIAISGDDAFELAFHPDLIDHPGGTLLFTGSVGKDDHPEYWRRLVEGGDYQVSLIIKDNQRSNTVDLRTLD
jgi:hypothetical protein